VNPPERKAAFILAGIAAAEGAWVYVNLAAAGTRFWRYAGLLAPWRPGLLGWALGLVTAALFSWYAAQLPSVRDNLLRPSFLKILAILVAFAAALCEEVIFRKLLMDSIQHRGFHTVVQVLASAIALGAAHAVWGLFRGSFRAATAAMIATGTLGLLLAVTYVSSHRVLAPCVVSHFLIDLLIEPGLVLAAVKGEMGGGSRSLAPR
jgi:uncharacterized protein